MPATRSIDSGVPVIRSVLVTTDFSPLANQAIPYACALLPRGGRLLLLNVQHPRALPGGEFQNGPWTTADRARHEQWLADQLRRLRRLIPAAARRRGLKVEALVIAAREVPDAIRATAAEHGVDALCLASHGYTGWKAGLLGSIAQSLMTRSTCPVLLVRAHDGARPKKMRR